MSSSRGRTLRVEQAELGAVEAWLRGTPLAELASREAVRASRLLEPAAEPALPRIHIGFQLTNACNLDCAYCCNSSGDPRPRELKARQWSSAVAGVHRVLGPSVELTLSGGEPLLVPWGLDVAEEAVEAGLRVGLLTNGTLITEGEPVERLVRLMQRGATVQISVAGTSAAECDAIARGSRFQRFFRAVEALVAAGGRPEVALMLLACSVDDTVAHAARFAERLPPDVPVHVGTVCGGGRALQEHQFRSQLELRDALERLGREIGVRFSSEGSNTSTRDGSDRVVERTLYLRSDGALFTCHRMLGSPVGHFDEESFEAVLSNMQRPAPQGGIVRRVPPDSEC